MWECCLCGSAVVCGSDVVCGSTVVCGSAVVCGSTLYIEQLCVGVHYTFNSCV